MMIVSMCYVRMQKTNYSIIIFFFSDSWGVPFVRICFIFTRSLKRLRSRIKSISVLSFLQNIKFKDILFGNFDLSTLCAVDASPLGAALRSDHSCGITREISAFNQRRMYWQSWVHQFINETAAMRILTYSGFPDPVVEYLNTRGVFEQALSKYYRIFWKRTPTLEKKIFEKYPNIQYSIFNITKYFFFFLNS